MKKGVFILMFSFIATIVKAAGFYWVNGQGNWFDFSQHWATSSGGTVFHTRIPGPDDDVYFDVNSFNNLNDTLFVDERTVYCRSMDWTGVTNQPVVCNELPDRVASFILYGNMILSADITWEAYSGFKMLGSSGQKMIKTFGLAFPYEITYAALELDCEQCQWELGSDIKACINLIKGDFYSNGYSIDGCFNAYLPSSPNLPGEVDLDTSKVSGYINIGYTADLDSAEFHGVVYILDSNSLGRIYGGNVYLIECTASEVHSVITDLVNSEVNRLYIDPDSFCSVNNFCQAAINQDQSLVHYAELLMPDVYINGGAFDTLKLTFPGADISLEDTIRVNDVWEMNGACNWLSFLHAADTSAALPVLELPADNIVISDAVVNGISVTGALSCTAANSLDLGLNTGIVFQPSLPRTLYWVGGTGQWNDPMHWSLSSGGAGGACVPTFLDTVIMDVNSSASLKDTVIFDAETVYIAALNAQSVADSLVFLSADGATVVNVNGSLQASSFISLGRTFDFRLNSASADNVLAFNVGLIQEPWISNSSGVTVGGGGEWNLISDFGEMSFAIKDAVVRTNDFRVKGVLQILETDGYKALYLGQSSVEGSFGIYDSTNLFVDADSASVSGSNVTTIYGVHLHKVNTVYFYAIQTQVDSLIGAWVSGISCSAAYGKIIDAPLPTFDPSQIYASSFDFGRLEIDAQRTVIGENGLSTYIVTDTLIILPGTSSLSLLGAANLNVSDALVMDGNCNAMLYLEGNNNTMIHVPPGLQQVSRLVLKNIHFSGTVSAVQSIDAGGNTGVSFTPLTSRTLYWVGGAGSWDDPNHWSLATGGPGGECVPTQIDSVILDQLSFNATSDTLFASYGTVCGFLDCRNVDDQPVLKMNGTQYIFGSFYLSADMQYLLSGEMILSADSGMHELDFANLQLTDSSQSWPLGRLVNNKKGKWNLLSDLHIQSLWINNGTFNYNDHSTFTADVDFSYGLDTTTINIGEGSIHSSNVIFRDGFLNSTVQIDADSAHIFCNYFEILRSAMVINEVICTGYVETDSTTFRQLITKSLRGNYNTVEWGDVEIYSGDGGSFQTLRMSGNAAAYGNSVYVSRLNVVENISLGGFALSIDSLIIGPDAKQIRVGNAGGVVVNNYFSMFADPQNYTVLTSFPGSVSDITLPADTICFENLAIDNVSVAGGGVYYAGNNSIQIGTCNGWTIGGCTPDTSSVWPGDVNDDQQVTLLDVLYLGIAHGYSGSARTNASLSWFAQPCINWPMVYANGSNVHNADTDGDGTVTDQDTNAIVINFGLIHPRPSGNSPLAFSVGTPAFFQLPGGNLPISSPVDIPLHIGTSSYVQNNIYGMLVTVYFNPAAVQPGSVTMDALNSWLADPTVQMSMLRYDQLSGQLQFALVRTDHQNVSGWGEVARLHFMTSATGGFLDLTIDEILLIDKNEFQVLLNVSNQNVHVSISETEPIPGTFEVYPNPGNGYLMWNKYFQFVQIDVYDVYGKLCYSDYSVASTDHCDLSKLATGTYLLRAHDKDNQTFFSRYEKIAGE